MQYLYDQNNVFAKIIRNELPSKKVYEDNYVLSFYTIDPKAKIHLILIPKGDFVNYQDFVLHANKDMIYAFFTSIAKITDLLKITQAYRIVSNNGENAGQEIQHFHIHIMSNDHDK